MVKFAANLTMMFNEVDFLDRFAAAADVGFKGVEYLFPYDFDKNVIAAKLTEHGLTQVLHNLPAGDWASGERGIACDPTRVGEFQDGVDQALEYAMTLGCKQINCLAGIPPANISPDLIQTTLVSNLTYAATKMKRVGINLLLEPINLRDIPGFYVCHTSQGRAIIEQVPSDNVFLQHDIYHMQIMEGDLIPTMESNMDIIRHIQLADNPGRNEPGTGEINYPSIFAFLDKIGYDGWIGCEYKPLTTTKEGLDWIKSYL